MLIDCPTVQPIMMARSVSEPRRYATPIAIAIDNNVVIMSIGTSTVSEGPRRVAKIAETFSLVAQLAPKSPVTICVMNIHNCTWYG